MIYFVRHGATDWNENLNSKGEREPKCQGTANIPLNSKGIKQAEETHQKLKDVVFDKVFCSPLDRTRKTCELVYTGNTKVVYDDRIIERNLGEFEGLMPSEFDFSGFWKRNSGKTYQKAETIEHFEQRIFEFLDELKNYDGNILVVSHGGVAFVVQSYFYGMPQGYNNVKLIKNGEYEIFDYNNIKR